MKIHIHSHGDPSVGIQGEEVTIDWHSRDLEDFDDKEEFDDEFSKE